MDGKLRLIQCGVGGFGKNWLTDITSKSPDFEVVALVDVSNDALEQVLREPGVPAVPAFGNLQQAIENVKADAILTITPPAVHFEHCRIAFEHGLHVMTEKPISTTLEAAREMIQLARAANRQLLVSQNYRFHREMSALRDLLERKAVGPLEHGDLTFYIASETPGVFRGQMPYPLLVDMSIHHFDLIRFITKRNIVRVLAANSFRPSQSAFRHEPAAKILLELEGGIPFSYCADWSARGSSTPWDGTWRLQCSEGSLHSDSEGVSLYRPNIDGGRPLRESIPTPLLEREDRAGTLHRFATSIRDQKPTELSGENNIWSFAAVMAAIQSAQTSNSTDVASLVALESNYGYALETGRIILGDESAKLRADPKVRESYLSG
jgi:predicted dehydrogenase